MNEKINVLDIQIDNLDAKGAMKKVMSYMETEPVNVVEVIPADVLVKIGQDPEVKECMEQFDLTIAGDREILEAAEINEHKRLQEIETNLFLKMLMRYFHKNHKRAFLLGETKVNVQRFREYAQRHYAGIHIVGAEAVAPDTPDDLILNLINGAEADCVITALTSPGQELFIARNRALVNTRIIIALGVNVKARRSAMPMTERFQSLFSKLIFKKQIERDRKKRSL